MIDRDIDVLQLEPTDVCQAECPLCARETDTLFDKNGKNHLSYNQIIECFPERKIKLLKKMFMCGVYGDPAAGKHTLDIYNQFKSINPEITLGMNTNGALRSKTWWVDIAKTFNNPHDYVVFSIDGLSDTNHIYRVNVDWRKLMENVSAFIENGGSAHWDMLVYQHNQHQVEDAKKLANQMGFTWFRAKVSNRPQTKTIKYPIKWKLPNPVNSGSIKCAALNEKTAYIDSRGTVRPCCWLAERQYDHINSFDNLKQGWITDNPHPVCAKNCRISDEKTFHSNQWREEIQLR